MSRCPPWDAGLSPFGVLWETVWDSGGHVISSRLVLAEGCFPGWQLPATWAPAAGGPAAPTGEPQEQKEATEGQVSRKEGTGGTGCGLCSLS